MKKNTGYIVLAVAGSIYIGFNLIITSFVLSISEDRTFHLGNTFLAEVLVFIPVAALFIGMQVLYRKKRSLFRLGSYRAVAVHILLLALFILVHAVWQVFFNAILLGADLNLQHILRDIIIFLNLRVLIYIIAIALAVGIGKIQERENKLLKQSELKLQLHKANFREFELKLNPAVIYPNLSFIKTHVCDRPDDTSNVVLNLSKQLRILIDSLDEERIPVKRDIQFFEHYFKALRLRLGRTITIESDVDSQYLNAKIPSMVLLVSFMEELFFGKYAHHTRQIENVLYKTEEAEEGYIDVCVYVLPVAQAELLKEKLCSDGKLAEINNLLSSYRESSLDIRICGDRLTFNLKMNLT